MGEPLPGSVVVEFVLPEAAIEALEGRAIVATRDDGQQFIGVLTQHIPPDGTATQVHIRDVITDELIIGTDIRNLGLIAVP